METIVTISNTQDFYIRRQVEHKMLAYLGNYLKKNKMRDQSKKFVNNLSGLDSVEATVSAE
jgi:hypothetical protein